MADVDDRWHSTRPRVGVKPCDTHTSSKGPLYPTTRHGIGRRWAARWRDAADRQRSRSFDKRPHAEKFLSGVLADLTRGVYIDERAGRETFHAYATKWLAMQTSDPATRSAIAQRLKTQVYPVLGGQALGALRPSTIQSWVSGLARTHAPGTIRVTLGTVSAILGAAVEDGLIVRNPCRSSTVRPPALDKKKVTPWTVERVQAVTHAMLGRYAAIVPTAVGLGLRQGEAFGLAVDAVDFLRGVVHVTRQVKRISGSTCFAPPKGGKTRTIPLPETVAVALAEHLRRYPATAVTLPWLPTGEPVTVNLVFTNTAGALDKSGFTRQAWRPALNGAAVTREHGDTFHVLRHSYASLLLSSGVDVRTLAEYLGHADPGFTLRTYTHLMPSAEDRARRAVDEAFTAGGAPDVRQSAR